MLERSKAASQSHAVRSGPSCLARAPEAAKIMHQTTPSLNGVRETAKDVDSGDMQG